MASVDDARSLAALSIPGTHDSGALFEPYPALAKCQDLTIADQLAAGVRYFDIRCRHFEDTFLIYHGGVDQNLTFDETLATMFAFLDAHPTETVIVSIKEESVPVHPTRRFEDTFAAYVAQAPERWHLDPAVPRLGEVRGKLVLLRRFDATAVPLGIDASPWANNASFAVNNAARLQVQDEYEVADNHAKWAAITKLLGDARADGDDATLYLDYTSGFQTIDGLSNITSVSDDINARLDAYLADPANASGRFGVLVMDHVIASRVQAVIATNAP